MLSVKDLRAPSVLWLTVGGSGFLGPAPGTWGSLAGLGLWWLLLKGLSPLHQLLVVTVYSGVSWFLCERLVEQRRIKDEPQIVADEVAGLWLALVFIPSSGPWPWLALGLFRFFDIVKPGPIGWLDRNVHSGLGIMLDDLAAGLLTGLTLALAALILAWGL